MLGGMGAVTVLTLALVPWRPRPAPPPPDNPPIPLREPTHVEPDAPPRPPRLLRLTVLPTPADSLVQMTNLRSKYMPGMALAPGTYTIRVTREGFVAEERTVTMRTADVTERMALTRLPPPPAPRLEPVAPPPPPHHRPTETEPARPDQEHA